VRGLASVFALALFAVSGGAWSDEPNQTYAGAALGVIQARRETAWALFMGYDLTKALAVEGSFTRVGDNRGTALGISLLPSRQFGERFSFYGRLGLFLAETTGDAVVGLGARFALSEKTGLRLDWQHFASGRGADLFTLGVFFRF